MLVETSRLLPVGSLIGHHRELETRPQNGGLITRRWCAGKAGNNNPHLTALSGLKALFSEAQNKL